MEDYTSACASLCTLPFNDGNGNWTAVSTGTNGANANIWYVSEAEAGVGRGVCGTSGSDASLHIGNVSTSPAAALFCPTGDCGAAYDASNATTISNIRASSPVINCTGKTNITLTFNYIMKGQANFDYATVWYFDGAIWSLLASPPQTAICHAGQGLWTNYTVSLPASANNNSNVQIGFNWQNNGDNIGTDPSVAIDSVTLSVAPNVAPVASFTCNDSTICVGDSVHFIDRSSGFPTSWLWTFTGGSPAISVLQNPVVYYGSVGTYTVKEVVQNISGKDSVTKVAYINVVPTPTVSLVDTTTICAGTSTIMQASGGTTYKWNTGATTSSISVTPATTTTYTVRVSNGGSCFIDTTIKITVVPSPTVTVSGNNPICAGQQITLTASGGGTYKWSNNATTSAITATLSHDSAFAVTVSNGTCTHDTTVMVTVNPLPVIALSGNTGLCAGDSTVLTGHGGGTYLWSTGATSSSIRIKPAADSTITLQVTSAGNCITDTTIHITVNIRPAPTVGTTLTTCQGTPVTLMASGGTSYTWHPGLTLSDSTISNPLATPPATIKYIVIVANGGCTAKDSEMVIVDPVSPITACCSTNIVSGGSAPLTVTPAVVYSWTPAAGLSCTTCQNPVASPTVTTWYYVTTYDSVGGCPSLDSVLITVEANCGTVFVPTAFSPNGDGQNDVLAVKCNPVCISAYEFKIYDRWGNLVFSTNDPSQVWDGNYKGSPMNVGTYMYFLNYIDTHNSNTAVNLKGNIALVK